MVAAQNGQRGGTPAGPDADQEFRPGLGGLGGQSAGGEVAVSRQTMSARRDRRAEPVLSAGGATRVWSYARR